MYANAVQLRQKKVTFSPPPSIFCQKDLIIFQLHTCIQFFSRCSGGQPMLDLLPLRIVLAYEDRLSRAPSDEHAIGNIYCAKMKWSDFDARSCKSESPMLAALAPFICTGLRATDFRYVGITAV